MTTQSAISGQSIGTGSNIGTNKFSINPLTFGATTTAYVVNVQLTNGATSSLDKNQIVRVWYATTMRTVTAANAMVQLGMTAKFVDLRPHFAPLLVRIVDSDLETITGSKFHCWVDAPTFPVAASLSVDLVELP